MTNMYKWNDQTYLNKGYMESNLAGFITKLRLIRLEDGVELVILHLMTCPIWYVELGSEPGSIPSSNLNKNEKD